MAGSYPDAPSRRMAWDGDGTVGLYSQHATGGTGPSGGGFGSVPWTQSSQGAMEAGNDENIATFYRSMQVGGTSDGYVLVCFLFPEKRELDGMYINRNTDANANRWVYKSDDTTNGIDGIWDNTTAGFSTSSSPPDYRDSITSMAFSSVVAVKGNMGATGTNDLVQWRSIHIYGEISPAETPDRILFLDTENSDAEFTKVLDFGDVPRGQTTTRTFKIINNSASKTINTIQVTAEDLYLNAGDWYEFGNDGISYQGTYAVGNLANGAEETIYLKQIIPGGETLGVQAGRIKVSHASVT